MQVRFCLNDRRLHLFGNRDALIDLQWTLHDLAVSDKFYEDPDIHTTVSDETTIPICSFVLIKPTDNATKAYSKLFITQILGRISRVTFSLTNDECRDAYLLIRELQPSESVVLFDCLCVEWNDAVFPITVL